MSNFKSFKGKTVNDALAKAVRELGPNAMIISTRTINSDKTSAPVKAEEQIEITALVPEQNLPDETDDLPVLKQQTVKQTGNQKDYFRENKDLKLEIRRLKRLLEQEIEENKVRKNIIDSFLENIDLFEETIKNSDIAKEAPLETEAPFNEIKDKMLDAHYDFHFAEKIISIAKEKFIKFNLKNKVKPADLVNEAIYKSIKPVLSFKPVQDRRYSSYLGDPNAGKTTSIAKLTINALEKGKKKIAILSISENLLNENDHLYTLSKLFNFPYLREKDPLLIKKFVEEHRSFDHIFIRVDNALLGIYMNLRQIIQEELNEFLVVDLAAPVIQIYEIIEMFKKIGYKVLLLTKLDKLTVFGNIFNVLIFSDRPVGYITKGKIVPDDITKIEDDTLFELLKISC